MTPEHLIRLYQQGKRDFIWADLRGVCLRGQCLAGVNFNRSNLQQADLSGADLSGCSFQKADLSAANLTAATLTDARFRKANLTGATLALDQLPSTALQGAVLPDGTLQPLEEIAVEAADGVVAAVDGSPPEPATALDEPERWAKSIDVQAEIAKRPPPPPPPRPRTRDEVLLALPRIPLGFFVGGFLVDGLVLSLSAAGGTAWVVSAIATQLWAIHSGLTWFIPITIALAALLGGPMAAFPLLVVPAVTFVMMMGGFLVVGWHWRTALHGAIWLAGVAAVLLCMTPWLVASGGLTAVVAPTALLAVMLLLAVGCVSVGLTGIEAMHMARIHPRHMRLVTGLGGLGGLAVGGLLGGVISLLGS